MSRPAAPLVSVLTVNYNGREHLEECLGSLLAQTYPRLEIVLVDNGSRDGSAEYVEERFPTVKVLRAGANLGFAGGNNFGLPHCRGDYVLFLNNDTRIDPGAVEKLVQATLSHPDVDVFSCFLLNFYRPELVDSAGDTLYRTGGVFSFQGYPARMFGEPRPVTAACAGAALYSRKCLERTGGFDEDFFLIFEDIDLSLRARHAGFSILFVPEAKVYHKSSASLGGKRSALAIYYCERNLPLLLAKDFPLTVLVRMLPWLVLLKFLALVKAGREGKLGPFLRGTAHGLVRLPGAVGKRKAIFGSSVLSARDFWGLLRPGWLKERLLFKKKIYDIPL